MSKTGRPEHTQRSMRQSLLSLYITTVAGAGIASIALTMVLWRDQPILGDFPILLLSYAALLILAEARPMLHLVKSSEVTGSWTFAFAMLFLAPPAVCLVAMAVATMSLDLRHGKPLNRSLFNTGQMVVGLTAGVAAGSQITDLVITSAASINLRWLTAALVAFAVAHAVNVLCMAVVIALYQGLPVLDLIQRSFDKDLAMDGLLLTLAPVLAVVGIEAPLLVPLVLITAITIYQSASIALSNEHEATHDLLTDIPNRRLFEDHAALMLRGVGIAERKAAVLQIDLDGFKGINDRLGHRYGDVVLTVIAKRLEQAQRSTDHVSRLGGDEFAIAIGELENTDDAIHFANKILSLIEEPMDVDGIPLAISASIGVSLFPEHGEGLPELLHHADTAMYTAKAGGGGVRLYEGSVAETGPHRAKLLADLGDAIGTEQLYMHYQPRVSIESGEFESVEALLRWDHPTHGTVSPGWFMPQTEQTELMTRLTDSVIDEALGAVTDWHSDGLMIGVAINVSARNLHDLRFPKRVAEAIESHDIDPGWIELEITENTVLSDPVRSSTVLSDLRAIGVQVSIDDFGTGYSSLANLRNLEIDCIKIDKSFVTDLDNRGGDVVIVRSIIDLAHNLGLSTVAEGVETQEVLDIVRDLGCDYYQGYLAARPMSSSAMTELLHAKSSTADASLAIQRHAA